MVYAQCSVHNKRTKKGEKAEKKDGATPADEKVKSRHAKLGNFQDTESNNQAQRVSFSEVDTLFPCPEFPTVIDLVSDEESEEEPDVVLADGEEFVDIFENPSTLLVYVDSLPVSPSLTPAQSSDALEPSIDSSDDDMPDLDDGLSSSD